MVRDNYALQHLRTYDADAWRALRRDLRKQAGDLSQPIRATDIDPRAIEAARQNARTAGVEHLIEFGVCDLDDSPAPDEGGILIVNPGYGKRLGDAEELQPLYKRIGDFLKQRCAGSRGFVFTGNMELAKHVGLRTSRRQTFYNADIEGRLPAYEIYAGTRKSRDDAAD
jgi:putative N6-adenine-specific DNA methylase